MSDETPSPVKAVRQFENDEAMANKLQQLYNDEAKAAELEQIAKLEDEFDKATRAADEERTAKALLRRSD